MSAQMTLDEIKTQHAANRAMGWRAHSSYDATAWLIAEVDRLTADVEACECSMLRQTAAFDAENDTLRAERDALRGRLAEWETWARDAPTTAGRNEVDRHTPASPPPDCHCDHYRPEAKDANATG